MEKCQGESLEDRADLLRQHMGVHWGPLTASGTPDGHRASPFAHFLELMPNPAKNPFGLR